MAPDLIVCCSDRTLIQSVLAQRVTGHRGGRHALPETLPEWQGVDRNADIWGIRHFSKGDKTGPQSDLPDSRLIYPEMDSQALGVSFSYNRLAKVLVVNYLSLNENKTRIASSLLSSSAETFRVKEIAGPTVALEIPIQPSSGGNLSLVSSLLWLGHDPMFGSLKHSSK